MLQRAVEEVGISTVSITLLEDITRKVKPPRALLVPYTFGHPLGEANNPELQHSIISETLSLFDDEATPPILRNSVQKGQ